MLCHCHLWFIPADHQHLSCAWHNCNYYSLTKQWIFFLIYCNYYSLTKQWIFFWLNIVITPKQEGNHTLSREKKKLQSNVMPKCLYYSPSVSSGIVSSPPHPRQGLGGFKFGIFRHHTKAVRCGRHTAEAHKMAVVESDSEGESRGEWTKSVWALVVESDIEREGMTAQPGGMNQSVWQLLTTRWQKLLNISRRRGHGEYSRYLWFHNNHSICIGLKLKVSSKKVVESTVASL